MISVRARFAASGPVVEIVADGKVVQSASAFPVVLQFDVDEAADLLEQLEEAVERAAAMARGAA